MSARSATAWTRNRALIGYILIVVSTLCFSANNNLAKESYSHGVSVDTVLVGRSWSLALLLGIWFALRGRWPSLPKGMTGLVVFAAVLFSLNAWALLSSFNLMPVSLSILVFYLFPFLVGLLAAVFGVEPLRPAMLIGLVVAFIGLVLTMDTEGSLNIWGILLALVAALAIAANILITGKLFRRGMSPIALSFWMMVAGSIFFSAGLLVSGGLQLPTSSTGWAAFAGTVGFVGIAFVTFFTAIAYLAESRTALVMNLEPIFTIIMAVFLLGEAFGWSQWVGAALVVLAIVGVTLAGKRR